MQIDPMKLLHNHEYWDNILGHEARKIPLEKGSTSHAWWRAGKTGRNEYLDVKIKI